MRTWTWVNIAATATNLVLVVACLGVTFALQYRDDELEPTLQKAADSTTDHSRSIYYVSCEAEVTRETFMCGVKGMEDWNGKWANAGCVSLSRRGGC
jgi:hypothetical protein